MPGDRRGWKHPVGRVIDVLTRVISARGAPAFLRSDNGPEFISQAILEWLSQADIGTALIDPGKLWQNGQRELQRQVPRRNMEWFRSRAEPRVLIDVWRRNYNDVWPQSSLQYRTPTEFRRQHESSNTAAILK